MGRLKLVGAGGKLRLLFQGCFLLQFHEVLLGVFEVDGHHAGREGGTLLDDAYHSVGREKVHESGEVLVTHLDVLE